VTTLGLGGISMSAIPRGEAAVSFRGGWLKHLRIGLSSAGGAAVILAAFELLQRQPQAGFTLLAQWGPWPFIALLGLMFLGRFLSRMNDTIQTTFSSVVEGVQQQAHASGRQADALTKLADQGGRQAEEMERLTIFAAQGVNGLYERMDQQDNVLQDLARSIKGLHSMLSKEQSAHQGTE